MDRITYKQILKISLVSHIKSKREKTGRRNYPTIFLLKLDIAPLFFSVHQTLDLKFYQWFSQFTKCF